METGAQGGVKTVLRLLGRPVWFRRRAQMFVVAFIALTAAKHVEARNGALAQERVAKEDDTRSATRATNITMATESTNVWLKRDNFNKKGLSCWPGR